MSLCSLKVQLQHLLCQHKAIGYIAHKHDARLESVMRGVRTGVRRVAQELGVYAAPPKPSPKPSPTPLRYRTLHHLRGILEHLTAMCAFHTTGHSRSRVRIGTHIEYVDACISSLAI